MCTSYPIHRFPLTLLFLEETLKKRHPSITFAITERWYNTDVSNTLWCLHYTYSVTQQEALQSSKRYVTQLYVIRGHYSLGGGFTCCVHRVLDKISNNDMIWFTPLNSTGHYMHALQDVVSPPYFFTERIIETLYEILRVQHPFDEVREQMRSLGDYASDRLRVPTYRSGATESEKVFDVALRGALLALRDDE